MKPTVAELPPPAFGDASCDPFDDQSAGVVEGRPLFARLLDVVSDADLPGEWGAGPKEPRS
jgi:hypothetical protein